MSQENVEVLRRPIAVAPQPRRRLEDRLVLRFPGVGALLLRLVLRLPPRSRVRQAVTGRAVRLGFEAANRGDFEVAFALYDSQIEFISEALLGLGFEGIYRGLEARVRWQQRWIAEWDDFQFLPEELIYLGRDRLFFVGHVVGSGLSSGATFDSYWANLLTISAGRVVHEHFFFNRAEALAAVGLAE